MFLDFMRILKERDRFWLREGGTSEDEERAPEVVGSASGTLEELQQLGLKQWPQTSRTTQSVYVLQLWK